MEYTRVNENEIHARLAKQRLMEMADTTWRLELDKTSAERLRDDPKSKVAQREVDGANERLRQAEEKLVAALSASSVEDLSFDEGINVSRRDWLDARLTQLEAEHAATSWLVDHPELDDRAENRQEELVQIETAIYTAREEYDRIQGEIGSEEPRRRRVDR